MTPTKKQIAEPRDRSSYGPFSEPQTIPSGWEVSSFYPPERDIVNDYGMVRNQPSQPAPTKPNDENTDYTL